MRTLIEYLIFSTYPCIPFFADLTNCILSEDLLGLQFTKSIVSDHTGTLSTWEFNMRTHETTSATNLCRNKTKYEETWEGCVTQKPLQ
jgi:hypothetical protein